MVQIVEVQTLDGTVENVEFPSDMSVEEIEAILRREFPSQDSLAAPPDLPLALPEVDRTLSGYIEEIPKGLASGVITTAELAATGISNLLPEDQEQQARSAIAKFAEDAREPFLPDQGYEDTLVRRLSEGVGSTAAFLPTAIMGKLGLPFALGLGAATQSGEAVRRAGQAGATEEEIDKAGQLGIVPGLLEGVVPFGLGRNFIALRKAIGDGAANELVQSLARVAVAAGAEGLQEASSEVAQNLIAQNVYDPETGTFTNTGEAFGLGAGVGGLLQGIFELVLPRSRGRTSVSPDQTAEQPIGELPTTADLSEVAVTTETPEQLVTEEVEPAPPATISPDVEEKLAEIAPKLRGTLKGRGLDDIGIELSARLNPEALRTMRDPQGVRAIFDPDTRTIMLGADRIQGFDQMDLPQAQAQFAGLVDHEMVHAVKAMNLWKDSEWRVLENAARRRTNSEGNTFLEAAQNTYNQESAEVQMEEAVAELMRETLAGRSGIAGQPLSLIQRMIEFLRKVGNSLTGTGFASFNQVISDVEGGVLGSRPRGDAAPVASTIMPFADASPLTASRSALGLSDSDIVETPILSRGPKGRNAALHVGRIEDFVRRFRPKTRVEQAALLRAKQQGFDTDKVWYHGTPYNFDQFKPTQEGQSLTLPGYFNELGYFFTDDRTYAARTAPNEFRNIIPVHSRVKNPFRTRDIEKIFDSLYANDSEFKAFVDSGASDRDTNLLMRQKLQDAGYDGILETGSREGNWLIAFEPNQVRSVKAAYGLAEEGSPNLLASRVKSNAQAQSIMNLQGGMTSEEVAAEARRQADQEARKEAAAIGIAEARAILDSSSKRRASRVPSLQEQEVAMDMSFGPEGIGRLSGSEEIARRALLGRAGLTPERMQRAREQGFDTDRVLYHGTTANVLALNPKKGQAMREGVFLTTNPDSAATYGPKDPNSDAGQMLYPVLAKTERPVTIDARGQFWQDIPTRGRVTVPAADGRGQEIMTVEEFALELARDENQNALILGVEDSKGLFGPPRLESDKFSTDELLLAVQNSRSFGSGFLTKRNIDSIIFENIVDNGPVLQTGEARRRAFVPADVVVLFAPEQARSINAEFREGQELNPRLLASRASIPLTPQEEALSGREILQSGGRYDDSTARLITRPFAELLDARVQNIFGRNLADTTPENKEIISNVMVDEALSELESEGNAVGWYKKTLEDMMDTFEQMYPVESQNPENVDVFRLALAITSNGQSVSKNTENALSIFDEYIETGKIPKRGFGDKAALMKKAFELFDNLAKDLGSRQRVFELFNKEGTAKKIEEVTGKKISGENVDTVLPYSAVLGPKIGIFYQNLNGNYEPLTVDRWFMKSWGRYTGTNVPDFDKAFPARAKKLRAEIKKLPRLKGYRKDRLARDDQELMRFARERVRAYAKTRFQDKTPVNKAANNLVKAVDDVKVEPTSGGERSWIREVTNEAVDKMRKQGVDMDAATLQALLWYAEKKIYSNHGITDKKSEPTDYATEIKRIARSRARPTGRSPDDNDRRRASRLGRAGREAKLEGAQENRTGTGDTAGLEPLSGLAADKSKVAVDPEDELQADRAASEEIRKTKRMASRTPVSDIVESTAYNRVADISSKRASRGQGTVENALPFEAPSGSTTDGFVYQVQDKYIDLKNATNQVKAIQKARGLTPLKDTENPYLGEESMHGIIGNKFNRFQEDEVKPLANKLVARNIPRKEFEEFLVLRHAIERNANIRKLNAASTKPRPDLVDGGAGALNGKRLLDNYVKSEMKSKYGLDWNNKTQSWTGGNRRAAILNDLASDFDSITRGTLKELKDSGLISQESFDNLNTHYKYYAPLRGRSPDEDIAIEEHARLSRGANNLSIAGIETERAKGRTSESLPPLGQIITQRQNAIRRGTINDVVGQRMLNIVREFPNDSYWKIYTEPKFSSVPSKELFGVKENGKQFYIEFKDDRLREAMMSLDAAQTGKVLGIMRGVNRYLSGVLTSYNPDFIVPNFFRDIETAISNLVAEQTLPDGKALNTKGLKRAVVADTPASIKQVYRGLRGKKLDKQLEIDWKEYLESGAKTEWFHVKTPEESSRDIDDLIAMAQGTFKGNVKAGKDAIAGFVSDVNGAVENGVRFATFKKARDLFIENGVPRKEAVAQAATLAKNLTVNFNRKGNSGELLNGLYLFFNASVQGTANLLRGMSSPAKQRLLASMVGFGALTAYLNEMISEEDDDGNSEYSNLSAFDKERNLIIMKNVNPFYDGPTDQAYKIPLPYGYNVLHVLGMYMSEVAMGLISPEQAAGRLTGAVLGSFSPIGFGEASNPVNFVAKGITPQIGKPVMEILLNEDFFGSPVYQDNYDFGPQLPLSSLSMSSTPDFWVNTTKFLNRLTKGTDTKGGDFIDLSWVSPDALHHLFGSFIGGTGQFVERTAKTAGAARDYLQGDYVEGDLEFNDIPIIRRFNASVSDFTKKGRYYDRRDEIILTGAQVDFLEGAEKGAYIQENRPKLLMKRMLDNTDRRIRNINKKLGRIAQLILTSPSVERTIELEEAQKRLEDSKMMLINRFNKRYNEVVGRTE